MLQVKRFKRYGNLNGHGVFFFKNSLAPYFNSKHSYFDSLFAVREVVHGQNFGMTLTGQKQTASISMSDAQDTNRYLPKRWAERARRFICYMCSKTFVVRRDLEEHVNSVHLKAKPFQCPHCSWMSSYKGAWQKHMKVCSKRCTEMN